MLLGGPPITLLSPLVYLLLAVVFFLVDGSALFDLFDRRLDLLPELGGELAETFGVFVV